jgi:hypothetical protein
LKIFVKAIRTFFESIFETTNSSKCKKNKWRSMKKEDFQTCLLQ